MNSKREFITFYHLDLGDPGLGGQGCFSAWGTQREVSRVESGKAVCFQVVISYLGFVELLEKKSKR